MGGLFELDIYKSIADRVDTLKLDSLINAELEERGIKAEFNVCVFNKLQQPEIILSKNAEFTENISH
jgi:hypothetical protein